MLSHREEQDSEQQESPAAAAPSLPAAYVSKTMDKEAMVSQVINPKATACFDGAAANTATVEVGAQHEKPQALQPTEPAEPEAAIISAVSSSASTAQPVPQQPPSTVAMETAASLPNETTVATEAVPAKVDSAAFSAPCSSINSNNMWKEALEREIVIDGETEMDDFIVAAHVAQADTLMLQKLKLAEPFPPKLRNRAPAAAARQEGGGSSSSESSDSEGEIPAASRAGTAAADVVDGDYCSDEEGAGKTAKEDLRSLIQPIEVAGLPERVPDGAELQACGSIESVIGDVICIKANLGANPMDLGSVVCLEDRRILGVVADTFGPTSSPFYVVYIQPSALAAARDTVKPGAGVLCDLEHASFLMDQHGKALDYLHTRGGTWQEQSGSGLRASSPVYTQHAQSSLKQQHPSIPPPPPQPTHGIHMQQQEQVPNQQPHSRCRACLQECSGLQQQSEQCSCSWCPPILGTLPPA
ncbi:uncharacterized protein LOC34621766 [Cyclospora cayetanensis]|uniref:H/ACA ribonucleoprotein complex non-core subunit NAF1 n=1 Tax=Cyclospora cayetanensis TaxID=88456 RepID=A0A6P6RRS5_9EIME|nr:uncharacterized protein LOC34621766 [Cyclospora cayetanensis]